jgi:hypothetical protein
MKRRLFLALGAAVVGSATACQVIFNIVERNAQLDAADAGTDASVPDSDICMHAKWPDPPDASGDGAGVEYDFLVAIDHFILPNPDPDAGGGLGISYGYDLDGVCTCTGEAGPSCLLPPPPEAGAVSICEDDGGRDVAFQLFQDLSYFPGIVNGFKTGSLSVLIRVRGYNGNADDPSVDLSAFVSNGLSLPDGRPLPEGGVIYQDDRDHWTYDTRSVLITDAGDLPLGKHFYDFPKFASPKAYVSNYILVAPVGDDVEFGLGAVTIKVSQALFTAKIKGTTGNGLYKLVQGQLVGRWKTSDVLTTIGSIHDPITGTPLCMEDPNGNTTYAVAKATVCGSANIRSDQVNDNKGLPCDALGTSLGFEAYPASFSVMTQGPPANAPCGVRWSDQCK